LSKSAIVLTMAASRREASTRRPFHIVKQRKKGEGKETVPGVTVLFRRSLVVLALTATPAAAADQPQHAETQETQSPAIITQGGNVTVSYGYTAERLAMIITAANSSELAELKQRLGVTEGAARAILTILGQQDVPFEQLPQKLAQVAAQYKQTMARLAALKPQDPITKDLVDKAQTVIEAGRFADADQLLNQSKQAEIVAAGQAEELEQQARAAKEQRLLRAAQDSAVQGDVALTQLLYRDAAARFAEAARLVPAGYPDEKGDYLEQQARALVQQGDERRDNPALQGAIAVHQQVLLENTRDRVPLKWAKTQMNLGNALTSLGERESGTTYLTQAVIAYQQALLENTRERVPLEWAEAQMNLGTALTSLGERESGTTHLTQAVTAFQQALQEFTRERVPLEWANTEFNLGTALQSLGERESDTTHLTQAVTAFQQALQELTRDRVPLQWARTQNNLGSALRSLGQRESDTAHLTQAVTAFQQALLENTRDRAPLEWANTEFNLGLALVSLAERTHDASQRRQALTCFKSVYQDAGWTNPAMAADQMVQQVSKALGQASASGEPTGLAGAQPRPRPATVSQDSEQPGQRAHKSGRARKRHHPSHPGRHRLPAGLAGAHP
jgi:tetratricopeptide (TPR) repeat protein